MADDDLRDEAREVFMLAVERLRETGREDAASFLEDERDAIFDRPSRDARGDDELSHLELLGRLQYRRQRVKDLTELLLRANARADAAEARLRDARGDDDLRDWLLRTVGVASSVPSAKRVIERLVADAIAESRVRDARDDDEAVGLRDVLTVLRGYDGDDHERAWWMKWCADELEREFENGERDG